MTEREILTEKVATFTEMECIQKLIEELKEALTEAMNLMLALAFEDTNTERVTGVRKSLIHELADVDTAGRKTLLLIPAFSEWDFHKKQHYSTHIQIPEAIRIKKLGNVEA